MADDGRMDIDPLKFPKIPAWCAETLEAISHLAKHDQIAVMTVWDKIDGKPAFMLIGTRKRADGVDVRPLAVLVEDEVGVHRYEAPGSPSITPPRRRNE